MKKLTFILLAVVCTAFFGFAGEKGDKLSIDYQQYKLKNGLDVILHQDKSDPIVAVAIQFHVGSNREVPGKTGFAHLFEHMMFQQSENVGQDQFFKKIQGAGGTLNGGTSNDGTIYYEVVPKNALEMVLWLESDRMGFLQNTVTKSAFVNQQNVVQNEKRQSYDNRPYGHNQWVLAKNLYPAGHPYSWTVIGEMEDLFAATIDDVKEFHSKFYVPNNTTLVLAGDFEVADVKPLIEKYFGEIPGGNPVTDMKPQPVQLSHTKKLFHEDNFAKTPQLTMVWPTSEQYSKDAYALSFLSQILGSGKKAPFYKVIVKTKKLASNAGVYNRAMELTGQFTVSVNANAGTSLAEVEQAIFESFQLFEQEGVTETDMERIKAGLETDFYNSISSVLGKSFTLARYNEYAGSPSFIEKDIENIRAVTIDDVKRVYEKYIKNKPYVATSFVPKGQTNLVAANSVSAGIVEENIENATKVEDSAKGDEEVIVKSKSNFDRSLEPAAGKDPELAIPKIWTGKAANGMDISGIEQNEVPLVRFSIVLEGGHLAEPAEKSGTAVFLASMLTEGTKNKTPEQLEEARELLGSSIQVYAGTENITISVNTLSRNFEKTLDLVEEMLLQPRWDEEQFGLVKSRMVNQLKRNAASPDYLASVNFSKLIYGENHILGIPSSGTVETVESITMDDLKNYYSQNFSPSVAKMHVAGSIDKNRVMSAVKKLSDNWKTKDVVLPKFVAPVSAKGGIYFVDVPGAKQSVIYAGNASIARSNPDYYPATVMNYKLGGSFNGNLNLILREEKGFTYGARSGFSGNKNYGSFAASSSVRSDATCESVEIFKNEIEKFRNGISADDIQFTKDALLKSKIRDFETLGALMSMLEEISRYSLPADFVKQEEMYLKKFDAQQHTKLAQKYLVPGNICYLVVGDAATQMAPLEKLGLGKPVLIKN